MPPPMSRQDSRDRRRSGSRRRTNNSRVSGQISQVLFDSDDNSADQNDENYLYSLLRQDSIAEKTKSECTTCYRNSCCPLRTNLIWARHWRKFLGGICILILILVSQYASDNTLWLKDLETSLEHGGTPILRALLGHDVYSMIERAIQVVFIIVYFMSRPSSPRANVMAVQMNFLKKQDESSVDERLPVRNFSFFCPVLFLVLTGPLTLLFLISSTLR